MLSEQTNAGHQYYACCYIPCCGRRCIRRYVAHYYHYVWRTSRTIAQIRFVVKLIKALQTVWMTK